MSYFFDDPSQLEVYQDLARRQTQEGIELTSVRALEWPRGRIPAESFRSQTSLTSELDSQQTAPEVSIALTVDEISQRPEPILRIVFAPLDVPKPGTLKIIRALYQHYRLPPCFLTERIQSVTHSFGAREDENGSRSSWFHFLAKDINIVQDNDGGLVIRDRSPFNNFLSQSDQGWNRAGFFLTWAPSSSSLSSDRSVDFRITLICFGAPSSLIQRFERVASHPKWKDVLSDPYGLFVIILNDLFLQVDGTLWGLSSVFRGMELATLQNPLATTDFVGLHNVAKHIIFLKEGSDAVLATLTAILMHHEQSYKINVSDHPLQIAKETHAALEYQKELFRSVSFRVTSLDRRMQNIINLSFNLVAQRDSRVLLNDSNTMKMIAGVTLLFLPITTVATIFGTQFFTFANLGPGARLHLAPQFWMFWVVAVPLTALVLLGGVGYRSRKYGWDRIKRRKTRPRVV